MYPQFSNTSTISFLKIPAYILSILLGVSLIIFSSAQLLSSYTAYTVATAEPKPPIEIPKPIPDAKPSCSAEQALKWWNGSKDLKAARSHLCK